MSEHDEQAAFFEWCKLNETKYPELAYFYAIPNGGKRSISVAHKLKAEGVKSGVLDTHLPVRHGAFIGLWIEFKFGRNTLTDEQHAWLDFLVAQHHRVYVCYNSFEAIAITLEYLRLNDELPFS